jgi:two-component system sensor histidine kinase MprB
MAGRIRGVSFRTRLSTFTAVAVGLTVALAALASYITVHHELYSEVDSSLYSEAVRAEQPIGNGLFGGSSEINPNSVGDILRRNGDYLQVITGSGVVEYSSIADGPPLPVGDDQSRLASANSAAHTYQFDNVTYEGSPFRVITMGGYVDLSGSPLAIQIAHPVGDVYHTLSDLRLILWLVTFGGVVMAVALGYLIGKATLRPVERLTAAAEHVAATQELDATIVEDGDDELARLAHAFNSMLTALAASRQQQAQLISDAGHELRTPLTSLRTNIEVLMKVRDLPDTDRAELIADVNAQLEEFTTLIGDVVDLARDDERQTEPIEVRLDTIVMRAVERARRRAPTVTFDTHLTPGSVRAQPALLERAVLNVLDNAAKWSPPSGTVSVWLQRGAWWTLDVRDEGPGIPPEDLPHIFDRFYRAQAARSMPGSGLGLAIVKQVVTAIGGSVSAGRAPGGGTLLHIELPIVAEQEMVPAIALEPAQLNQPADL